MAVVNNLDMLPENLRQQYIIEQQQKEINALRKELGLYQKWCVRPKILKEIIHHSARPRTSTNMLGTAAYEDVVYE